MSYVEADWTKADCRFCRFRPAELGGRDGLCPLKRVQPIFQEKGSDNGCASFEAGDTLQHRAKPKRLYLDVNQGELFT